MAVDQDYRDHVQTWVGFTRFMKWGILTVVAILILLALTLL